VRVVFVTRQYWPAVGGVESVVEYLGAALCERGHEVTVVAQCVDETHFGRMTHVIRERLQFAPFTHKGMPVVQFRPSRLRRALLLPLAAELIPLGGRISRKWLGTYTSGYYASVVRGVLEPLLADADVVHVLGSNFMAVAAVEAAHALGKGVAVSPFAHLGEWGDDSVSIRAYLRADAVLATTAADAAVYAGLGVPAAKLHVAGLPVPDALVPGDAAGDGDAAEGADTADTAMADDVSASQDASAGYPVPREDGPLVLYLGQRRPTKRVDLLLAATEHVWASCPGARFAFVGPGSPLSGEDPRILDVGRVSDFERGRWLLRADVLCLPSSSESFGLVVAEAWSQRVPVVVSDIPVLAELVTASGGGLIASADPESFAQAVTSLLNDPARARSLGQAGYEYWRAQLTPDAAAERHLEIYEGIRKARAEAALPASTSS
jgi:glycosyltransferase involved in cell wall biosynthesis